MPTPRKRPLEDPKQPYVYVWRIGEDVLWVGKGRGNRGRPTGKSSWSGRPPGLVAILETDRYAIEWSIEPFDTDEQAQTRERELIALLKPKFNTATGVGGFKGMHTEDGLRRISEAAKNRKVSDDERSRRSERMKGNTIRRGSSLSEETKKLISESLRGRKPSELCRKKSAERAAVRNVTNPPRKGKACSAEHRRKLSESAKKRSERASQVPKHQ